MIGQDALEKAIGDWIELELGETAIVANQPRDNNDGAPRPDLPYSTYDLSSFVEQGTAYVTRPDGGDGQPGSGTGDADIISDYDFTVSVQCIGPLSRQRVLLLNHSRYKESVRDTFNAAGLALIQDLNTTDATGLLETHWEEKTIIDFQFRVAQVVSDHVGIIETAELNPTFS